MGLRLCSVGRTTRRRERSGVLDRLTTSTNLVGQSPFIPSTGDQIVKSIEVGLCNCEIDGFSAFQFRPFSNNGGDSLTGQLRTRSGRLVDLIFTSSIENLGNGLLINDLFEVVGVGDIRGEHLHQVTTGVSVNTSISQLNHQRIQVFKSPQFLFLIFIDFPHKTADSGENRTSCKHKESQDREANTEEGNHHQYESRASSLAQAFITGTLTT